jgi:tetratricopeptide (TPR) repeat protein
MKRFFLSFLILIISAGVFAQKGKVNSTLNYVDNGNLEKAKEAMDGAEVHEKTKDWPKTYYAKGRLAQAMYESNDDKIRKLYDEPLMVAYNSYLKSIELDDKDRMSKMVILQIPQLSNDFLTWAGEEFEAENFKKSLAAFETLISLQKSDLYIGMFDTVLLFNAGIVAINAEEYDKALDYFEQCIEMEYGESQPYEYMHSIYNTRGDMENAEKILIAAFEKFEDSPNVMLSLIQFYLVNEMDKEAMEYITMAKADDPNNYRLFWAEGVLYMKQERYEDATVALAKSIELEPEFFDTQYNMGVCYYNMGVNLFEIANDILDNEKYNAAVEEAKEVFAKAIPYMEKALELNPEDVATMTSLKELYYRLQMTEKYDAITKKLDEIEG